MIDSEHVAAVVAEYLDRYPGEAHRLAPLTAALTAPDDPTSRTTVPGHVTCSAIVLGPGRRVLRIRSNV
jgi:hypothetical protein